MTTITANPLPVNWSRNDIIFKLNTNTTLTEPGLAIELVVFFYQISTNGIFGTNILDVALTPDTNGDVTYNLRKILDNHLQFQLPAATGITAAYNQSGLFSINYRESTIAIENAPFQASQTFAVIKGGLPLQQWTDDTVHNYFNSFTYSFRQYMTWKKPGLLVAADELRYLTYLHSVADATANSKAVFVLYYTDGSSQTFNLISSVQFIQNVVYHIPVGIAALLLDTLQPDKKINYYTVQPFADNNALTAPFTYTVDYRRFDEPVNLHYFSSIGGMELARVLGDVEKKINRISSVAASYRAFDASSNVMPYQEFDSQVEEKIIFSCNIGNMEDPEEQDALRDLLISKRVYEFKHDRWRLIRIITDELSLGNKNQSLFDLPFEWTYAVTNDSYAPDNLNLNA